MGLIGFMSNVDDHPQEIYLKYKARWEIEECFDYLSRLQKDFHGAVKTAITVP
jgi:hypothetical protein